MTRTPRAVVYYGAVVNPVDLRTVNVHPRALLAVAHNGTIAWFEESVLDAMVQTTLAKHAWIDAELVVLDKWEWLMPGFIDTHTHAPQFPNIGSGQQYQLLDWLQKVTFPTEANFRNTAYAQEIYPSVVRRLINNGTTTCSYYATIHLESTKILANTAHHFGQRAYIGKCNMNTDDSKPYTEPSVKDSIDATECLISHIHSLPTTLVHPIITPRFAISCTKELLDALGKLAAKDRTVPIQTHISENKFEIQKTLERFPDAKTYAEVYDHAGLLQKNTILAHAVHLTDSEMELVKKRQSGISHCPTSNLNLSSGCARVGEMLDRGIKVGLGTDCSGGYSPSILTAIQHASITSKVISFGVDQSTIPPSKFANKPLPVETLLYLATVGGARVCNIDDKVGQFAKGMSFDALRVSVKPSTGNPGICVYDGHKEVTEDVIRDRLEKFLFCGDDRNILDVWVAGRLIGGRTFVG